MNGNRIRRASLKRRQAERQLLWSIFGQIDIVAKPFKAKTQTITPDRMAKNNFRNCLRRRPVNVTQPPLRHRVLTILSTRNGYKDTKQKNGKFESFVRDKSFAVGGGGNRSENKIENQEIIHLIGSLLSLVKSILIVEFSVVCFVCNWKFDFPFQNIWR